MSSTINTHPTFSNTSVPPNVRPPNPFVFHHSSPSDSHFPSRPVSRSPTVTASPDVAYPVPSTPSSTTSSGPSTPFAPTPSNARKCKDGHVPRPENCFFIFRSAYGKQLKNIPGQLSGSELSKIASERWHALTPEERMPYENLAARTREQHKLQHPNYKYAPKNFKKVHKKERPRVRKVKVKVKDEKCLNGAALTLRLCEGANLEAAVKSGYREIESDASSSPKTPSEVTTTDPSPAVSQRNELPNVSERQLVDDIGQLHPNTFVPEFAPNIGIAPLDLSLSAGSLQDSYADIQSRINPLDSELHTGPQLQAFGNTNSVLFAPGVNQNLVETEYCQTVGYVDPILSYGRADDCYYQFAYGSHSGTGATQLPFLNDAEYALIQHQQLNYQYNTGISSIQAIANAPSDREFHPNLWY